MTHTQTALSLQPTMHDLNRAEIEAHLDNVRARRMYAVMTFHEGANLKLDKQSAKVRERIEKQYALLQKEILRLDTADDAIQKRLKGIETLNHELGLIEDMKVVTEKDRIEEGAKK